MDYFVGKVCTIMTAPTTMAFSDFIKHAQYFTGLVESIDGMGVWVRHPQSKSLSYFMFPLVGIVEEQVVDPKSPLMDKINNDIKKKEKSEFLQVDDIAAMMRQSGR